MQTGVELIVVTYHVREVLQDNEPALLSRINVRLTQRQLGYSAAVIITTATWSG